MLVVNLVRMIQVVIVQDIMKIKSESVMVIQISAVGVQHLNRHLQNRHLQNHAVVLTLYLYRMLQNVVKQPQMIRVVIVQDIIKVKSEFVTDTPTSAVGVHRLNPHHLNLHHLNPHLLNPHLVLAVHLKICGL